MWHIQVSAKKEAMGGGMQFEEVVCRRRILKPSLALHFSLATSVNPRVPTNKIWGIYLPHQVSGTLGEVGQCGWS